LGRNARTVLQVRITVSITAAESSVAVRIDVSPSRTRGTKAGFDRNQSGGNGKVATCIMCTGAVRTLPLEVASTAGSRVGSS
jgi:hypothetical protein